MKLSAEFRESLDREPGVIVVLDRKRDIVHLNRAWSVAAMEANAGELSAPERVLHRPYLDFVSGPLKQHVQHLLDRADAMEPGVTNSVWLEGECHTPDLFRHLTTRVSAMRDGDSVETDLYLIHHDLKVAGPLEEHVALVERPVEKWRDENGFVLQCGCCRRVRDPKTEGWAMSRALLKKTAHDTSHGLCELCLGTYYSEQKLAR